MRGTELTSTIDDIARRVDSFGRLNDKVAMQSHILAVNSMIEAARAGHHGRGFSVVAAEMKMLSGQTKDNADQFRQDVLSYVQTASRTAANLTGALREASERAMIEKAHVLVQLIVRNLFERTADVRWWATDPGFWEALARPGQVALDRAQQRLATIHRYYTVYLDLLLTDMEGRVLASAAGGVVPGGRHLPVDARDWFDRTAALATGHDYAVSDVHESSMHGGRKVLVYATPVRREGDPEAEPIGVLAVYFDWQKEAQMIVRDEAAFTDEEWTTRRVLLLDAEHRIIADSHDRDFLTRLPLGSDEERTGCLRMADGARLCFARTLGYEDYDGLGWYGAVIDNGSV